MRDRVERERCVREVEMAEEAEQDPYFISWVRYMGGV